MLKQMIVVLLPLLQIQSITAATVSSNSGSFTFNCPNQQSPDNAVASQCPAYTKSMTYKLLGDSAFVRYSNAPANYATQNGFVGLTCSYGLSGTNSALTECRYSTGGSMPLTLDANQPADCAPAGTKFSQPSGGPSTSDFTQTPMVTCPYDSSRPDRYVYSVTSRGGINNSNNRAGGFSISCTVNPSSGQSTNTCNYDGTGSFISGVNTADCPQQLCSAVKPAGRRSLRARQAGSHGAALVAQRQVDTNALRAKVSRA